MVQTVESSLVWYGNNYACTLYMQCGDVIFCMCVYVCVCSTRRICMCGFRQYQYNIIHAYMYINNCVCVCVPTSSMIIHYWPDVFYCGAFITTVFSLVLIAWPTAMLGVCICMHVAADW